MKSTMYGKCGFQLELKEKVSEGVMESDVDGKSTVYHAMTQYSHYSNSIKRQ